MLLNSAPPPSALVSTSVFSVVPLCPCFAYFLCSELGIFSLMLFCNVSLWLCRLLLSCMYRRIVSVFFLSLGECRPLSFENMDIFLYCCIVVFFLASVWPCFIPLFENLRIFFFQSDFDFWICLLPRSRFNFSFIRDQSTFLFLFILDLLENRLWLFFSISVPLLAFDW